ncbi:exonuclease SbcCD subunit D [Evansella sp. LMS18]|uniref:exonuclease SbcCD subunit D n=1 Tax=Evansella sp. LMS18 TaxID=2924033 RepID=UPI0020D11F4A|nr:exonuclease SbcCD subunit D [Evansella sp. LMS18]UTR09733.1 exonuclease SbcCD subunit D [Evansella sp. LMS18]
MRLLHTADWHLGRTLEGRDRHPEHEAFLEELQQIVKDENIDAVLLAGDVFDSVNPPAKSEELFYESMARLTAGGDIPVAVIAGNHDHPDRLGAARSLIKKQNISVLGYPSEEKMRIYVPRQDQFLNIAALPYPSESRLKESFVEEGDEEGLRDAYDVRIQKIFEELTKDFTDKEVNVAMSHLFVAGGSSTESERPIEVGGAYTIRGVSLPGNVQYTALGHLHRPQNIKHSKKPARYSGSPLALSFSEAGYAKSVTVVDVNPGEEAVTEEIFLSAGKPLVRWRATEGLKEVLTWMEEKRDADAWIELEVHMDKSPSMEMIHQMKKDYPGLLTIRPVFPEEQEKAEEGRTKQLPVDEMFRRFYSRQTGGAIPDEKLTALFLELVNEEETE